MRTLASPKAIRSLPEFVSVLGAVRRKLCALARSIVCTIVVSFICNVSYWILQKTNGFQRRSDKGILNEFHLRFAIQITTTK
jgi:hypothetical protein